ncbi:MAG: DNA translocase FtsK [Clostridiales bacterium]|nr:DNA translocase FtsK [Clostridiales bacterium]
MATFQVSNKEKKKSNKNVKVITGWTLLASSTFIFLFSITNILPFLRVFLLGIFGVFAYPLSLIGMIVSLALLNNKKYVMPKSYAVCLMLSLYLLLSIIQLIILGDSGEMGYGEYIGLNYSKQITAGGIFIGFIPSTLMYFMGTASTYVLLAIAFITSVAFFLQAYLSIRKTRQVEKPIKLQIKEKDNLNSIEQRREAKVYQKEAQEKKVQPNVMLDGHLAEEEQKQQSVRRLLGLVGGNQDVEIEQYQSHQMEFAGEESKGPPEGMSIREYLLAPPKVDLKKFQQQAKPRAYANYFINNDARSATNGRFIDETIVEKNINQLKESDKIVPSFEEDDDMFISQGNLTDVKPEEITTEAEDIIKLVVEQEKRARGENINLSRTRQQNVSAQDEDFDLNDLNEFIDFDDVEETPKSTQNFSRDLGNRRDFSRDMSRRDDFARAREGQNNNFDRRNNMQSSDRAMKPQYNDEMDRRRGFVTTSPDKKEEIKPYKYNRPSLDLITTRSEDPATFNAEMRQKTVALENALESFGIPAKVQGVVIGPTVTRYEIEMPEGISVKRILSLDADIAYALSANGQIRIEAPIPGRSIVGIEVPNKKVAMVSIKDVLNSKEFNLSPSPLTFALGKDITGNVKVCNLQKMPHLLVAGTTGSGKSVCLNTIITSLVYKSSPDEVKFIMIDPKQVELSMYEGLPHMIVPKVITDPTKAVNALGWAVDEMERRFKLISEARVRNLEEYNKTDKVLQNKAKKMPYVVIIFDEFADFMAVAKNEIEDKIRRLAGKARAAGIHLILATQRPSTDVVTGTLKANLPARIAFKVAGRVDSEVIMGATGAEKLLGYGDMLYKPADTAPQRIQGCYIATEETKNIVNYIVDNNEETYDAEALEAINNPNKKKSDSDSGGGNATDELLPHALKLCIDNGVASTTMVQRKLSIGYPRAARLIDQMEERGYISTADGAKQRSVFMTIEEFYSTFGDIYD